MHGRISCKWSLVLHYLKFMMNSYTRFGIVSPKSVTDSSATSVLGNVYSKFQSWNHFAAERIASVDDEAIMQQVVDRSGMIGVRMADAILADAEKGIGVANEQASQQS